MIVSTPLTLGPQVVCNQIASCLFGLMTLQTYLYFYNFPNDTLRVKLLVSTLWILKAVHWSLSTASLYELSVKDFGHPDSFNILPIPLDVAFIVTGLLYLLTQSFFCRRIYVISGKWYLSAVCWFMVIARVISIFALCALIITMADLEKFADQYLWLLLVMFALGVVSDASIAALQSYFLWKMSRLNRSPCDVTKNIIDILVRWTIQTGTVTCLLTISVIICLITMRETWIWLGLMTIAPGVWSNSLLASLNGRIALHAKEFADLSYGTAQFASAPNSDLQGVSIPPQKLFFDRERTVGTVRAHEDSPS